MIPIARECITLPNNKCHDKLSSVNSSHAMVLESTVKGYEDNQFIQMYVPLV